MMPFLQSRNRVTTWVPFPRAKRSAFVLAGDDRTG